MTRDQRKRRLSRDDAVAMTRRRLVEFTGDYEHQVYGQNPSSVGKVAVGWVVEFKPIRPQTEDGNPRMALTWVVSAADQECYIVGSIGLTRTLAEIETGSSLR